MYIPGLPQSASNSRASASAGALHPIPGAPMHRTAPPYNPRSQEYAQTHKTNSSPCRTVPPEYCGHSPFFPAENHNKYPFLNPCRHTCCVHCTTAYIPGQTPVIYKNPRISCIRLTHKTRRYGKPVLSLYKAETVFPASSNSFLVCSSISSCVR